jgi:hypothetical protein
VPEAIGSDWPEFPRQTSARQSERTLANSKGVVVVRMAVGVEFDKYLLVGVVCIMPNRLDTDLRHHIPKRGMTMTNGTNESCRRYAKERK